MRTAAERTGGQAFMYEHAEKALSAIDHASRTQYLLGYYPSRTTWDGSYRNVVVKVKRSGSTVLYRHGYFAQSDPVIDDGGESLADARIEAAGTSTRPPRDIDVDAATDPIVGAEPGSSALRVTVKVDMKDVEFRREDSGLRRASIDLAIFVGDSRQNVLGDVRHHADVKRDARLTAGDEEPALAIPIDVTVSGDPRFLKVIAYDRLGDRLGVAVLDLRRR